MVLSMFINELHKIERFKRKVIYLENGCWDWDSTYRSETGYPMFYWGNEEGKEKTMKASRASYILHKGPIPEGMCVCHACDNRDCVNPEHLWLGTHQDNMDDRSTKGRTSKGAHRYNFKQNEELIAQVTVLRNLGDSVASICKQLEIGTSTYYRIAHKGAAKIRHHRKPL